MHHAPSTLELPFLGWSLILEVVHFHTEIHGETVASRGLLLLGCGGGSKKRPLVLQRRWIEEVGGKEDA